MKLFNLFRRRNGKTEASRQAALKAGRSQNGCQRTRPGWACARKEGHEGPCAAVPVFENPHYSGKCRCGGTILTSDHHMIDLCDRCGEYYA